MAILIYICFVTDLIRPYTPLESANSRVTRFAVSLPEYVDKTKIGVNLPAMHVLCRLGGIAHLRVATIHDGETTRSYPSIVGVSRGGEAVSGLNSVQTVVPTHSINSQDLDKGVTLVGNRHPCRFINTTVTINTNETNTRILNDKKWTRGVRSPEAWGYHIDTAVKHGILKSGLHHLVFGLSKLDAINVGIQYCLMAFFEIQKGPTIESAVGRFFTVSGMLNLINFAFASIQGKEYRLSTIYGPQVDRAIALALISSKTTLVKGIPDST